MAKGLEGLRRQDGIHAAAVVITKDPLTEYLPIQRKPEPGGVLEDAPIVTQYEMHGVEDLGLLKMDFLGLTNLTILGKACEVIKQTQEIDLDLVALPDNDEKTSEMLAKGETFGVFQMESAGMRRYVQDLRPSSVKDLAAMVALYRPGPMQHIPTYIRARHGLEENSYPHPDLAEILDETYGVIVYQDQVLLIAQKFAGYSLGEADVMRKAMGKKVRSIMKGEEDKFLKGAVAKGYSKGDAQAVFDLIEPFAGYAFNKAHSVSYGTIAYQTAYLKANYPEEYMTAVMMMAGTHERIAEAFSECVRLSIPLLRPDINQSDVNFSLQTSGDASKVIRYGLSRVKNVGEGIAEGIVEERSARGGFTSLDDFFERVNAKFLNKRALECLVKAGAFDGLTERGSLLASLERLCEYAQATQKQREAGQASLFDMMAPEEKPAIKGPQLESAAVATQQQRLSWEKELLGIYLSEHPFAHAAESLASVLTCSIIGLSAELAGRDTIIGGLVAGTRSLNTKDGRTFIAAEIEDLTGSIEVTVWPETYEQTRDIWTEGNIIVAAVRIRDNNDRLQVAVQRAHVFSDSFDPAELLTDPAPREGPNGRGAYFRKNGNGKNGNGNGKPRPAEPQLRIVLDETDDPDSDQERLKGLIEAIRDYSGADPVRLQIRQSDGAQVEMELPPARYCAELTRLLGDIVGPWGNVYV